MEALQSKTSWNLCCLVLLVSMIGCQQRYGEVSPTAYEYAKALYSIANRRDAGRLDLVESQLAVSIRENLLSAQEQAWLQQIVSASRQGNWTAATRDCRTMMEEQAILRRK